MRPGVGVGVAFELRFNPVGLKCGALFAKQTVVSYVLNLKRALFMI